ncbi:Predicted nuclease of the RNAse H fold, HicB family [Limimonas halophila]|uniref:Predicted nuclease of the RNAse H fold, HicB family n=2 Tax=Limimonas halophila TaxID=1082479 RepID=A0A1G7QNH6_9PROT|nr:type II toxin-antitoxin system HicB family antitoxin [Limimonas halophila]SDG00065.1 Predicted nuclease of the RNAse H fold, HicB family [Limimonas halophila]
MKGYYAIVRHAPDNDYRVIFPDLPGCGCTAPTVEEALHQAEQALRLHLADLDASGEPAPAPRPADGMLAEAARISAVAAACLRPPAA